MTSHKPILPLIHLDDYETMSEAELDFLPFQHKFKDNLDLKPLLCDYLSEFSEGLLQRII